MQETKKYSKSKEVLNQVSRSDLFSQDNYYGLSNSFQYSENINADDEMHGIKLAQKIHSDYSSYYKDCQLIEAGDKIVVLPIKNGGSIRYFDKDDWDSGGTTVEGITIPAAGTIHGYDVSAGNGTIFQNNFWFSVYIGSGTTQASGFYVIPTSSWNNATLYTPYDHTEDTDESISDPTTATNSMFSAISFVLNFNNTRLIVATGNELRVYYPELDHTYDGQTGWKKVQQFYGGSYIVGLTSTFEYLKVWVQDRGRNTKVFYYQANNDFRSTFVYNQVELTNTRVMRVYSINGIDYYTASLDGTDGFLSLNKLIGSTPVQIFTRKGGLVTEDIFSKAGYFIGPTALDAAYLDGNIYMADSHGVFKFQYNPSGKDIGYLKWKINQSKKAVTGLAICQNYLYTSDETGLHQMRLYDTGEDGYESTGILISREMEGNSFQGCFTKMLDEIRLNYELNPLLGDNDNGKIEVYVSPNNTWTDTNPAGDGSDGWYKVMEIKGSNKNTRTQYTNLLNNLSTSNSGNKHETGFEFDWQTITYLIKINIGNNSKATPIVREIQLRYHTKGKTNEIYDIK